MPRLALAPALTLLALFLAACGAPAYYLLPPPAAPSTASTEAVVIGW